MVVKDTLLGKAYIEGTISPMPASMTEEETHLLHIMETPVQELLDEAVTLRGTTFGPDFADDLENFCYHGKRRERLDEYRLEGIKKILETDDAEEKLKILHEYGTEMETVITMLNYREMVILHYDWTRIRIVCRRMLGMEKYSMSEIAFLLELELYDVYKMAKEEGYNVQATDEELAEIRRITLTGGYPDILDEETD